MSFDTSTYYKPASAAHIELFIRISSRMLTAKDEDSFFDESLADIGRVMQVSRCYVFDVKDDLWSNTYEWVAQGVTAHKDSLLNLNFSHWRDEGNFLQVLKDKEPFIAGDVSKITDDITREMFLAQGIISIVSVPLFDKENIAGFFGLDQCVDVADWTEEVVNAVIILGNVLNNAMMYFKTQRILQKKKMQVQALFDAFPYPIYVSSMDDYSVLFYNKAIATSFDVSSIKSKKCYEAFQNLDAPCPFCTNAFLEKGAPPYVWHHKNPITKREYKIIDRCTSWEHTARARFSVALDITDTLRLQREQVYEREANITKGLFLANMSHELRTPLNGIIGMTHLANEANKNSKVEDYLGKIQLSSRNLLAIINDILDFSKLESNEIELEHIPFSFKALFFETQAILQAEAERKGLSLHCFVDEHVAEFLYGDVMRLSQVLLNLANNAMKFTTEGSVRMEVRLMHEDAQQQHLELNVHDTGIGISAENIKKLFTAFTQAETSTTRNFGGTGLGLTIVQHLVHLMGGTIRVESVLGEGSSFICSIPFTKAVELPQTFEQAQADAQDIPNDISGVHILLVEDNEINTIIATEVLEQYGCHVDSVTDGLQALDIIEQKHFDLVLMDIQMPHMDGLEATRHIRKNKIFNTLPIVAMSAHALVQDHEKSYEAGMQAHVIKPFVPEELRSVIYQFTKQPFLYEGRKNA